MPSYIVVNYQVSLYEKDTINPLGIIGVEDNRLYVYLRAFDFLYSQVGELSQRLLKHYQVQLVAHLMNMLEQRRKPLAIYRMLANEYRWNFFVSPPAIDKRPIPVIVAERVPEAVLVYECELK